MDHKYKSLLQNVATRHVIAPVDDIDIKQQLSKLRQLDIVNFFVLGTLNTIKSVLDSANAIQFFGRKFAWHVITQDRGELKCNCKNATVMFVRPLVDPANQDRLGLIKTSYQLTAEPEITAAFYFDITLYTALAVK